jgi:hypothetical protein
LCIAAGAKPNGKETFAFVNKEVWKSWGRNDLGAEYGCRHVDFRDVDQNSRSKLVAAVGFFIVMEAGTSVSYEIKMDMEKLALPCP